MIGWTGEARQPTRGRSPCAYISLPLPHMCQASLFSSTLEHISSLQYEKYQICVHLALIKPLERLSDGRCSLQSFNKVRDSSPTSRIRGSVADMAHLTSVMKSYVSELLGSCISLRLRRLHSLPSANLSSLANILPRCRCWRLCHPS